MGRQNLGRVEEKVTSEVPKRRRSTGRDAQGLKSLRRNRSFAPSGLNRFRILPTARAVGFNLAPLRGCLRARIPLPESREVATQLLEPQLRTMGLSQR